MHVRGTVYTCVYCGVSVWLNEGLLFICTTVTITSSRSIRAAATMSLPSATCWLGSSNCLLAPWTNRYRSSFRRTRTEATRSITIAAEKYSTSRHGPGPAGIEFWKSRPAQLALAAAAVRDFLLCARIIRIAWRFWYVLSLRITTPEVLCKLALQVTNQFPSMRR